MSVEVASVEVDLVSSAFDAEVFAPLFCGVLASRLVSLGLASAGGVLLAGLSLVAVSSREGLVSVGVVESTARCGAGGGGEAAGSGKGGSSLEGLEGRLLSTSAAKLAGPCAGSGRAGLGGAGWKVAAIVTSDVTLNTGPASCDELSFLFSKERASLCSIEYQYISIACLGNR